MKVSKVYQDEHKSFKWTYAGRKRKKANLELLETLQSLAGLLNEDKESEISFAKKGNTLKSKDNNPIIKIMDGCVNDYKRIKQISN